MAEQKHTSEPWQIRYFKHAMRPRDAWVVDGIPDKDGDFVGNVIVPPTSNPQEAADKARIVACVNGCQGISDPSAVGELVEAATAVQLGAYLDDDVINRHALTTVSCEALRKLFGALSRLKGTP